MNRSFQDRCRKWVLRQPCPRPCLLYQKFYDDVKAIQIAYLLLAYCSLTLDSGFSVLLWGYLYILTKRAHKGKFTGYLVAYPSLRVDVQQIKGEGARSLPPAHLGPLSIEPGHLNVHLYWLLGSSVQKQALRDGEGSSSPACKHRRVGVQSDIVDSILMLERRYSYVMEQLL